MSPPDSRRVALVLALALSALPSAAQVPADAPSDAVYRTPPGAERLERPAPAGRSAELAAPVLQGLVPEHAGRTLSPQPALFWFLSGELPPGASLQFTLVDDVHVDPLVEVEIPEPQAPGIQRIDLARYGVELAPDTGYEWSVALVRDPWRRSLDVVTTGWIDRVAPPAELAEEDGASARRLAAAGLWYDALAKAVDDEPSLRDALLRDVGLLSLVAEGGPSAPVPARRGEAAGAP